MAKPRKHKTAKQRIAAVLKWADRQGFFNIAEELHCALAAMPDE